MSFEGRFAGKAVVVTGAASNAANLIKVVTALKRTGAKIVYGGGELITGAISGTFSGDGSGMSGVIADDLPADSINSSHIIDGAIEASEFGNLKILFPMINAHTDGWTTWIGTPK